MANSHNLFLAWHKNTLANCPKQVRHHRLRPTGAHTHKEVFENYPGLFTLPSELDEMAQMLDKERKEVREWATVKLKTQMLTTAHSLDLQWNSKGEKKFSDIAKGCWVGNRSEANAKKMHEIVFGRCKGHDLAWSVNWERELMEQKDRDCIKEATKDGDKKIGCYQKQITMSKIAQIKNLIKNFELKIQMSVPKGFNEGKRDGRRKKGEFCLLDTRTVSWHERKQLGDKW